MDEGEHYAAYAFYPDDDVLVFLYTLHVSFVAFVYASDDSYLFVFFEI